MREFVPHRPSLRYRQRGKNVLQRRPRPYREIVQIDHYFNHPNRNKRKRLRRKRKRPGLALPLFVRRWKQLTRWIIEYWCTCWPCKNLCNSRCIKTYHFRHQEEEGFPLDLFGIVKLFNIFKDLQERNYFSK